MTVRMNIAGYRREGRTSMNWVQTSTSSEVERAAYQNLALVRLRALRSQVDDAITRARGESTDRYSYSTPEPKREDYRKAVMKLVDASIREWEAEVND